MQHVVAQSIRRFRRDFKPEPIYICFVRVAFGPLGVDIGKRNPWCVPRAAAYNALPSLSDNHEAAIYSWLISMEK
jgi:hypothetical protein